MRQAAVAFLLVAVLLAGCTRDPPSGGTAKPLEAVALAHAQAWNAVAELHSVMGLEIRNGTQQPPSDANGTFPAAATAHDDLVIGDGRAPAWMFSFAGSPDDQTFSIVLDSGGNVLAKGNWSLGFGPWGQPVTTGDWLIDSDEAWKRAAAANASLQAVRERDDVIAASILFQVGSVDAPLWLLTVEVEPSDGPSETSYVFVNARNGTLHDPLDVFSMALFRQLVARESGAISYFVTAREPAASDSFTVSFPYRSTLAVAVTTHDPTPPAQAVSVVLLDAEDQVVLRINHTRAMGLRDAPSHARVETPPAGTYRYLIELDPPGPSGVAAHVEVSWCTDGKPMPSFPKEALACKFVDDRLRRMVR